MAQLELTSLKIDINSSKIGSIHKQILSEKQKAFQTLLNEKKKKLDVEYKTYKYKLISDDDDNTIESRDLLLRNFRMDQQRELNENYRILQSRLEDMSKRFQREWMHNPTEHVMEVRDVSGSESQYLAETVGLALQRALAEVCEKRPADPIDYVAHWLLQHANNTRRAHQAAVDALHVRLAEEEVVLLREAEQDLVRERKCTRQEDIRRKELFLRTSQEVDEAEMERQTSYVEGKQGNAVGIDPTDENDDNMSIEDNNLLHKSDELSSKELYTIEERENEALLEES